MQERNLDELIAIKTIQLVFNGTPQEVECDTDVVSNGICFIIGKNSPIGVITLYNDNSLEFKTKLGSHKADDWYRQNFAMMLEERKKYKAGENINLIPIYSEDFIKIMCAFRNLHSFSRAKASITAEPMNDEHYKNLIREMLRTYLKPVYSSYDDAQEEGLVRRVFKDAQERIGIATADKHEEYYYKWIEAFIGFCKKASSPFYRAKITVMQLFK